MERKKVLKRTISKDLIPLKDETWLTQPLTVTMMRHDFSLVQNRILVQIVSSLQKQIKKQLNKSTFLQLDLFDDRELDPEDKTKVAIKIEYKSISPDNNYYALENALRMLAHIPVDIPARDGTLRTRWEKSTNLCTVYIDRSIHYNKYAVIKIDKEIAEKLINKDFGYSKLGKEIVEQAANKFAQRIYMMMTSWSDKGKCSKNTLDLRKSLRLESKYENSYLDFERRVLKPAAEELKNLFDDGFCDLWFEYQPNYSVGQRKKEYPPTISFTIHTQHAKENKLEQLSEQQKQSLVQMLETHLKVAPVNAIKIVERAKNYNNIATKIVELVGYIKEHKSEIGNIHAYIATTFDNYFKEESSQMDNNPDLL